MADFRLLSSQVHFAWVEGASCYALDPGGMGQLELWGGGPAGEALAVSSKDSTVVNIVSESSSGSGTNLRSFKLHGARIGLTMLEARMPNGGGVWAQAQIAVGFTPGKLIVAHDAPLSGAIPFSLGAPSFIRIPVPGSNGLAIELSPRGWVPKSGSTSTLFVQDVTGKRHLRLDFGYNVKTSSVNYHWNQAKTFNLFKIADHTQVGAAGAAVYKTARYFKYAGRTLGVVGVAIDVYSVVASTRPLRQATKVVSGWGGAWLGCKLVGAGGAWVGTAVTPGLGTAVGGVTGCLAGAFIGYEGASRTAARVYDWGEAQFHQVPETAEP